MDNDSRVLENLAAEINNLNVQSDFGKECRDLILLLYLLGFSREDIKGSAIWYMVDRGFLTEDTYEWFKKTNSD
jgi:hypothetical protein